MGMTIRIRVEGMGGVGTDELSYGAGSQAGQKSKSKPTHGIADPGEFVCQTVKSFSTM